MFNLVEWHHHHWIQHEILVQIGIVQYFTRQYWPILIAFTHQKLMCLDCSDLFGIHYRPQFCVPLTGENTIWGPNLSPPKVPPEG